MEGLAGDDGNYTLIVLQVLKESLIPTKCHCSALYGANEESAMGEEWLITTCPVAHMCALWHRLKVWKRKVVLLWGKKNSPSILSILTDARIKKYGYICSAQWYGTALSTLCSSILFTYISKICVQRIQNKFRFDVGQRSITHFPVFQTSI